MCVSLFLIFSCSLCQTCQQEIFSAAHRGSVRQWQCQVPGGVCCKCLDFKTVIIMKRKLYKVYLYYSHAHKYERYKTYQSSKDAWWVRRTIFFSNTVESGSWEPLTAPLHITWHVFKHISTKMYEIRLDKNYIVSLKPLLYLKQF